MIVQNEKMAALGKMILSISHEVNNPNNFISFNIPILKEYILDLIPIIDKYAEKYPDFSPANMPYIEFRDDLNKLLTNIENGSRRISRIVSDLKEFSRRKEVTNMEWIDLNELIESIMTISGTKIRSMVKSFEINIDRDFPQFHSDRQIMELIIINLLNNAAEATDKNDSRIRLDAYFNKEIRETLIIEVSDNGCGINKSHMEKIFDPFFSTKTSKEGTGMGLYLCRTLVDQIGGQLEVESEVGKGSTFRIVLTKDGMPEE
jgi:signal transduction histidine kinase